MITFDKKFMKNSKIIFTALLLAFSSVGYAQKATEANKPSDSPLDFSQPANIVLFIVLPVVIIILYFVWRRAKRNDSEE